MTIRVHALAIGVALMWPLNDILHGAEISMTGNDPGGTSSFNEAGKWSNAQAPTSGNTYVSSYLMRTPESASSFTFAGDRLTFNSGSVFGIKSWGSLTINDFVLNGGAVSFGIISTTSTLEGNLAIAAPSAITLTDAGIRWWNLRSALAGTADLTVYLSDLDKRIYLLADNSDFTGGLHVRGGGRFVIANEVNLGGNPAAYRADQLTLGGVTLAATNSFAIDDNNRGILLDNTALTSSVSTASGNLTTYTYPGGVFEINAATVTVACAISGEGPLAKTGGGTLTLAATNTYTGLTTVEGGTLRLAPGAAHAASSCVATGRTSVVEGEGTLSNLTLAAGARLAAEGNGWDIRHLTVSNNDEIARISLTLSDAATNTPTIRIGGPLVKPPFQKIVLDVSTNSLLQTPCLLLAASNLTDYAIGDFYVSPPWLGTLSFTNDAGGGTALALTPRDPATVVRQTSDDSGGTSAFTRSAAWSDGLAPSVGKVYINTERILRTPSSGSLTFAGDTLFVGGAGLFALKGTGMPTVPDLVLFDNATVSASEGGTAGNNLAGTIRLLPSDDGQYAATFLLPPDGMGRTLRVYAPLTGWGDILLSYSGTAVSPAGCFAFQADSPDFFGRISVGGNTNVWLQIASEETLGANPPLFRAGQLSFAGGGLSVTNDVTLDDANRGITLTLQNGTLRPETGTVLTVNCPITGAGALMKKGAGTLVLGGENSYTGLTSVFEGVVRPASAHAFGESPVLFASGSTLQRCDSDTALTNGVEFAAGVTFETGSTLQIVLDDQASYGGAVTVPLFLLPCGETLDLETLSVRYALPNYRIQLLSESVGEGDAVRELVSAQLTVTGTLVSLK